MVQPHSSQRCDLGWAAELTAGPLHFQKKALDGGRGNAMWGTLLRSTALSLPSIRKRTKYKVIYSKGLVLRVGFNESVPGLVESPRQIPLEN